MILYHGNQDKDMIPEYGKGKYTNDYGRGFYTTADKELAKEWSYSNYSSAKNTGEHWLHSYELFEEGLKIFQLTEKDILYWLAQLYKFRTINDLSELQEDRRRAFIERYYLDLSEYDVIVGWRADDSYFKYARDFLSVDIYKETLEEAIKLGNLGVQYFIQSKKAFEQLKPISAPEPVESYYRNKYLKRDTVARSDYELKKASSQYNKGKITIIDMIK